MRIDYYHDYWHYFDPSGKEYTLAEFHRYLDEHYPKKYDWDYSTQAVAERNLVEKMGWTKKMNEPTIPPLEEVAGKFLLVGQHTEPRAYIWDNDGKGGGHWEFWKYQDLDTEWWRLARPDVVDERTIQWGHSCWKIEQDGTLTFSGANYDSSD